MKKKNFIVGNLDIYHLEQVIKVHIIATVNIDIMYLHDKIRTQYYFGDSLNTKPDTRLGLRSMPCLSLIREMSSCSGW